MDFDKEFNISAKFWKVWLKLNGVRDTFDIILRYNGNFKSGVGKEIGEQMPELTKQWHSAFIRQGVSDTLECVQSTDKDEEKKLQRIIVILHSTTTRFPTGEFGLDEIREGKELADHFLQQLKPKIELLPFSVMMK